jgi:hypothetical protein
MFTLTDEIAAARYHKKHMKQSGPIEHEHAIHAFVFLSFLFAEAIKLIIETWIRAKDSRAEVIFLVGALTHVHPSGGSLLERLSGPPQIWLRSSQDRRGLGLALFLVGRIAVRQS